MGIYVALNIDALGSHERLFLKEGTKEGAASGRYCEQLLTLVDKHQTEVLTQMRPDHFNPYGWRKGSATHAVSGTTLSPSLPSIARRGEWSQGMIFDVYLHFAAIGDHYLGRILACLQPNSPGFATLPPHFNIPDPMANEHVQNAMEMLYQSVLVKYSQQPNDPTPMLLRCLACIIYHVDSLLEVMVMNPGHDFSKLAILHDPQLIAELKPLVTTEPTPGIMTMATGIPPHIELANQVQKVLDVTTNLMSNFGAQTDGIINAVKAAIEEKAWDSGHITGSRLVELLEEFQTKSMKNVDDRLTEIRTEFSRAMNHVGGNTAIHTNTEVARNTNATTRGIEQQTTNTFTYGGRFYAVPKDFKFPKVKLREAIRFWLCGYSVSEDGNQRIKPFKNLTLDMLPDHLKNEFKLQWKPIFGFISDAANFPSGSPITSRMVNEAYERCVDFLKTSVSYCFLKKKNPEEVWSIATWSVRVSRSSIEKDGTESDKEKLAMASNRNKPRGHMKRNRPESDNPLYGRRQQKRKNTKNHDSTQGIENTGTVVPQPLPQRAPQQQQQRPINNYGVIAQQQETRDFASVFGHVRMTAANQERDAQIIAMVQREMTEEMNERREQRAREGDAVANDGTVLFVRHTNELPSNNGDNSNVSRTRYVNTLANLGTAASNSGTPCPIPGCQWSINKPDHPCYNSAHCKNMVHNLCAGENGLYDDDNELNMYCSARCKQQKRST